MSDEGNIISKFQSVIHYGNVVFPFSNTIKTNLRIKYFSTRTQYVVFHFPHSKFNRFHCFISFNTKATSKLKNYFQVWYLEAVK